MSKVLLSSKIFQGALDILEVQGKNSRLINRHNSGSKFFNNDFLKSEFQKLLNSKDEDNLSMNFDLFIDFRYVNNGQYYNRYLVIPFNISKSFISSLGYSYAYENCIYSALALKVSNKDGLANAFDLYIYVNRIDIAIELNSFSSLGFKFDFYLKDFKNLNFAARKVVYKGIY